MKYEMYKYLHQPQLGTILQRFRQVGMGVRAPDPAKSGIVRLSFNTR